MKKAIVLLALVLLAASNLACVVCGWPMARGSGRLDEEVREVSGFTGVELATIGELVIEIGDEEELRIEAEDNLIQYFETTVRQGTLKITNREGILLSPTRPVTFYLVAKELDAILLSGSGRIQAPDLEAEQITLTVSGSGDMRTGNLSADDGITMLVSGSGSLDVAGGEAEEQNFKVTGSGEVEVENLVADALEAKITGSGDIRVSDGEIERQEITLTGSGDYTARRLESATAQVRITGSGQATVWAEDSLDVSISGSGDVHYVGNPTVTQSVTGSGDVDQM